MIEIVDLDRAGEFLPGAGDEGDAPGATTEDGFGQLLQGTQLKPVVGLRAFDAVGFVGEQVAAGHPANTDDIGVVADGVGFFGEYFGLVEGQATRRPASFQEPADAGHGDAVPVVIGGVVEVARVVEDGDEEFAGGGGLGGFHPVSPDNSKPGSSQGSIAT